MTTTSNLMQILAGLAQGAAASVVAHGRPASPGLNAALLRRLSSAPGEPDSWLADTIFESAKIWDRADQTFGALSGALLHPRLVDALDRAPVERMARDVRPYRHQLQAFQAAREGRSYIVTSGTGSGKTECFMIPILDDLLREPQSEALRGVRAIVIYPLNALIES
jgi:DEAD/DEAH box helicase domain-containing protein